MFKLQPECIWKTCNIANHNPFGSIITGDFNARSNTWYSSDKTTYEAKELGSLNSQCGFKQVLSDPTHILEIVYRIIKYKTNYLYSIVTIQ